MSARHAMQQAFVSSCQERRAVSLVGDGHVMLECGHGLKIRKPPLGWAGPRGLKVGRRYACVACGPADASAAPLRGWRG